MRGREVQQHTGQGNSMIELKRELEALADQWHNYIGGGTMTNKEHTAQLRKIIAKYDFSAVQSSELVHDFMDSIFKGDAEWMKELCQDCSEKQPSIPGTT